jgi:hypothetical protein
LIVLSFAAKERTKERRLLAYLLRSPKGAMRCWEKLDWAAWRWISARCILCIGLIASIIFSF